MGNAISGKKTVIDTIEYVKNSSLFTNSRYSWTLQLINDVLNDNLQEDNVDLLIDTLLERKKKQNSQKNNSTLPISVHSKTTNITNSSNSIKKLLNIETITNVGLLEITDPFKFKDGLNVFYGKNGTGKSTLYSSLCKTLGKDRNLFSNVNKNTNKSYCCINVESKSGKMIKIEWRSDQEQKEHYNVKIFDTSISNFIVQQDQVNKFELAHLKMEYFAQLYDLYDLLERKFLLEKEKLEETNKTLEELLSKTVPFILEENYQLNIEIINKLDFNKKEEEQLKTLDKKISKLKQSNIPSVLKNMENVLGLIEEILSSFGSLKNSENHKDKPIKKWKLIYINEYFLEINKKIEDIKEVKKAFEESGRNKVSSLIPNQWISNGAWEKFINSSIDFLSSLSQNSKTYLEDKCIYCQQPLKTEESKALVAAYHELHKEHEGKLLTLSSEVDQISEDFVYIINLLNQIGFKNNKIKQELENINKDKEFINFEFDKLSSFFKKTHANLIKKEKIIITSEDNKLIKDFWDKYYSLYNEFSSEINSLQKSEDSKEKDFKILENTVKPFREKKQLFVEKKHILDYLNKRILIVGLKTKLEDIISLRQLTSSLRTSFTQEAPLKEFKKYLEEEYKALNFLPPKNWGIKPVTREGINKRIYNIGDRRLSEIFSEGEQKLHALSDFFAQCLLDKYKGIYIFDDPVNSLDDENIESVSDRILTLLKEGNQVIVFTHNLYFLNSIINTQNEKITKLECQNNQIVLVKELNIGEKQELKDKLKKIDLKFKKLDAKKADQYDIGEIYNLISGYIEEYVEKVYFKNVISRYRPNIRMNSLGDLRKMDITMIDKILKLYEKSSRRGTRHSQPKSVKQPKYTELVEDVQKLTTDFK